MTGPLGNLLILFSSATFVDAFGDLEILGQQNQPITTYSASCKVCYS